MVFNKMKASVDVISNTAVSLTPLIRELEEVLGRRDEWVEIRLGNVLHRRKDAIEVEDDVVYKRLRIQVKGRGVLLRDEVLGLTRCLRDGASNFAPTPQAFVP